MKFIIVNGTLKPSSESNTSVVCEMVKLGFEKFGHECEIVNTAELNYKNSTQDEDDDLRPVIHRMIQPEMRWYHNRHTYMVGYVQQSHTGTD